MKTLQRFFAIVVIAVVAASCGGNATTNSGINADGSVKSPAKYVFYFIGDGMTATQVRLAEAALTAENFRENYAAQVGQQDIAETLSLQSLGITGLATSNAANRYITDSAAAGTALATGVKTNVGVISQDADGNSVSTMAERAKAKGMKVGIVSSVSIDHATPACFYAHIKSRNQYSSISDQLLTSGFDYFAGGSVNFATRAKAEETDVETASAAYRVRVEEAGFKYVTTKAEFDAVGKGETQPVIATIDLLANKLYSGDGFALPYTIDLSKQASEDDKISLAQFTQKGIDLLENDKGFFMMVEGGKIDWACHANDAATSAYEMVAFDQAIGVAMEFAAKHPKETLIVVTGDHDCGGLTLGFAGTGYQSAFDVLGASRISSHVFSPKAMGMIQEGASFDKLLALACENFGFTNNEKGDNNKKVSRTTELTDFEVKLLEEAYKKSIKKIKNEALSDSDIYHTKYGWSDPFTTTCTNILNNKSGVEFASFSHTAVPVMVFADGANAALFSGYYDNTDIAKKIMQAAAL